MTIRLYNVSALTLLAALIMTVLILPSKSATAEFRRIITLKQFEAALIGRSITGGGGNVIIHADGTVTGTTKDNQNVSLTWRWQFGHWCRGGTVGSGKLPNDCQQVWIKCKFLRLVRNWGRGSTVEYKIRNPQQKSCIDLLASRSMNR